jgi:hypothetical protein
VVVAVNHAAREGHFDNLGERLRGPFWFCEGVFTSRALHPIGVDNLLPSD